MSDNKRNNKILIAIIAVLAVVVIGLIAVIVNKGKNKDEDNTTTEAVTEETNASDSDADKADDKKEAQDEDSNEASSSKNDEEKLLCYATVTSTNSWESNGKQSGQLDIKIVNNSSSDLKDWSVKIEVGKDTTLDSFWNCNTDLKDGVLTLTPVEYNGSVASKQSLGDIGIIVTAASAGDFNAINQAVLYVDGVEYKQTETADAKDDENSDKKDEDKTDDKKDDSEKPKKDDNGKTPYDNHGKLSVKGTDIVDSNGDKFQLKGPSTHGIAWFPDYVSYDTFKTFRDDWGANMIRIAMYTDENGGYCSGGDKAYLKGLVDEGVNAATDLGMYVIVDWHILHDLNPQVNKADAIAFFEEVTEKYKDYDNVIYEICNEPNGGTSWSDVKSYAEEVIPVIRKNCPDAIIIVGTPTWSQDVDIAANDPITGYDNIMYAVHFYATTHKDNIRNKAQTALDKGIPVFISECSICDASGNGAIDYGEAEKWFSFINDNNLSYAVWNISNKDETSSLISSSCNKTSGWSDDELSETGKWFKDIMSK